MDSTQPAELLSTTIPSRAAAQIAALITQHQAAETALRSAVQLLADALCVPDGSQLQVRPDGSMVFVCAANNEQEGAA